tara:strand:+ start:297 stop:929 length:633 start_codon:yes stop_codon:yes gene_type:complete
MALATSGALTLDQIHVEAGGSTGTTCSLNDSDIRGLTAAAGKTINSTLGTSIDFDDFYGASSVTQFDTTLTVGQSSFVAFGYNYKYRGYAVDTTFYGPFGSLSSRQNSNFFGNEDIDNLMVLGAVSPSGAFNGYNARVLLRMNGSSISNDNNAFTSMTVNGTQYNRSDGTFTSSYNQWTWDYNLGSIPNDTTSAISPMPAVGQTCTVTFL